MRKATYTCHPSPYLATDLPAQPPISSNLATHLPQPSYPSPATQLPISLLSHPSPYLATDLPAQPHLSRNLATHLPTQPGTHLTGLPPISLTQPPISLLSHPSPCLATHLPAQSPISRNLATHILYSQGPTFLLSHPSPSTQPPISIPLVWKIRFIDDICLLFFLLKYLLSKHVISLFSMQCMCVHTDNISVLKTGLSYHNYAARIVHVF